MNYRLKVNGKIVEAEIDETADESCHVLMGDKRYHLSFFRAGEYLIRLEVDGRGRYVCVGGESRKEIVFGGREYAVEDAEEPERSGGPSPVRKRGESITPPMPALVVKVLVKENDTVDTGDPVVIISAMKLETTLKAPHAGKVVSVNTAEGKKVMPGDILVDIDEVQRGEENHE